MAIRYETEQGPRSNPDMQQLLVHLTLNAMADCKYALELESDALSRVEIENALLAVRDYRRLGPHSVGLSKARSYRLNRDRENPEHWNSLNEGTQFIATLFGSGTELELFQQWREYIERYWQSQFHVVTHSQWNESKNENCIWYKLVQISEPIDQHHDEGYKELISNMTMHEARECTQQAIEYYVSVR